jgi:hypothetical protein
VGIGLPTPLLFGVISTMAVDREIDDSRRPSDKWAHTQPRWERRVGRFGGLFVNLWASSPA